MAVEKDFELLDDYLANRLNADEKASFEKQLEADPELNREFNIQQRLVEGIKKARHAELKSMLQSLPVPPPAGSPTLFVKLGVAAVVAGLVGFGAYTIYTHNQTVTTPAESQTVNEEPKAKEEIAEAPKTEAVVTREENAVAPETKKEEVTKKEESAVSKKNNRVTAPKTEEAAKLVKPEAFDPSEDASANTSQPANEGTVIEGYLRSSRGSSILIENVADSKKYNFHYQFKDGKLLLYGQKFREKNMYEILEFFVKNKRATAILFHENSYYLLKEGDEEIKQLKPITDPALLNKLKEYRGN